VALFRASDVTDNGNGTSTLETRNFGAALDLCEGEPFREQPFGAFCSGFLVGHDIVATAGHCVNASNVADVRFVFGFRMLDATNAQVEIDNAEIYGGLKLIGRREVSDGADWALVRIDRRVTNHRIVRLRRTGLIASDQAVQVIGHPNGLPTKFADGATVRNNQPVAFFVANLDTYGGNSGSPVFNSDTHVVEGILVRGENDFVSQGDCNVSLVCPTTGCRGEDCTRTTEFTALLGLNLRPPVINFGSVPIETVRTRELTIENLTGLSVSMSFPASPAGPFTWPAFTGELADGAERTFSLEFRAASNAIERVTLTVTSTAPGSPHSVGLVGKGPGGFPDPDPEPDLPTRLEFVPQLVNFGSVPIGTVRTRTLTIRNPTTSAVNLSFNASPAGSPFGWSAFSGTLGSGQARIVNITFRPASGAIAQGALIVTSTAGGSPHSIGLIGKGPGGF
jgi:hypothetical protein